MPNLIGQTIGQYRIIEQIGRGGMATVYKAFQPSMERNVAIKVLPEHLAEDPTFIERFRLEAKAIAQLEHPHILPVYDYGEEKGLTYMVMRYMDSGTLTARLRKGLEVAEVVRLLGQVAEALDYTHSRGIVHRDIKPSNILIDARGETLLTDFGIAKMVEGTAGLTGGAIVGTPIYMSPEQAQGRPADGRSDLYSLGIILYEALVGRPPFEAETPMAVLMQHINAPLPLPGTIKPEISEAMERVILKALAKDPADRYRTAGDMKRAMEQALISAGQGLTQFSRKPEPVSPSPSTFSTTLPSPANPMEPHRANRLPLLIGGGALALILGAILAGWSFLELFQNNAGRTATPTEAETAISGTATLVEMTETPTEESKAIASVEPTATPTIHEDIAGLQTTDTPTATASPTPVSIEPTAAPTAGATLAPAMPPTATPEILTAVNVTNNPGRSDAPSLALDGEGTLHLGWWDTSTGKVIGDFLHRQMTPDGQWSDAEILTTGFETALDSNSLKLIRNPANGQVCAFWDGATGGGPDSIGLYMRCWADTLTQVEKVYDWRSPGYDYAPALAPDGTLRVAINHQPQTVLFGDTELSDGFKTVDKLAMVIDQAGGYHAVWVRQGSPFTLEHRYSDDNGQTWQEAEQLTDEQNSGGGLVWPFRLMADNQGNVHLVFVSQNRGIFYRRWISTNGWGPSVELTLGRSYNSSTTLGLAVDDDNLAHVVWQGPDGVFYTQQAADDTWSIPSQIAEAVNSGPGPEIVVDHQGVRHFVWQVEDDAVDLYYATLP